MEVLEARLMLNHMGLIYSVALLRYGYAIKWIASTMMSWVCGYMKDKHKKVV